MKILLHQGLGSTKLSTLMSPLKHKIIGYGAHYQSVCTVELLCLPEDTEMTHSQLASRPNKDARVFCILNSSKAEFSLFFKFKKYKYKSRIFC